MSEPTARARAAAAIVRPDRCLTAEGPVYRYDYRTACNDVMVGYHDSWTQGRVHVATLPAYGIEDARAVIERHAAGPVRYGYGWEDVPRWY